jgi:TonB family protein
MSAAFLPFVLLAGLVAPVQVNEYDELLLQLNVTPPQVTTTGLTHRAYVPPEYPREAFRRGQEGWVDVELTVDASGRVLGAEVIASQPRGLFERAALRAVRQWQFEPPREVDAGGTVRGVFRVEFQRGS